MGGKDVRGFHPRLHAGAPSELLYFLLIILKTQPSSLSDLYFVFIRCSFVFLSSFLQRAFLGLIDRSFVLLELISEAFYGYLVL